MLHQLKQEEFERLKRGRKFPLINAGDSIAIQKLPFISAPEPDTIKGLVIGVTNRSSDTALKLMNVFLDVLFAANSYKCVCLFQVEHGTPVYRRIIMYSPMNKDIKVLQRNALHKGKKRVKRAKLYYVVNKHPELYMIK